MKTSFPESEVYVISYVPGTSGEFIAGMISSYVGLNDNPLAISEFGDAHHNSEFNKRFEEGILHRPNLAETYFHYIPVEEDKPIVISGHAIPDYYKMMVRFPKYKSIIITCSQKMWARAISNHFFKRIYASFMRTDIKNYYIDHWERSRSQYDYLRNFLTPQEAPAELLEKFLITESLSSPPYWAHDNYAKNISQNTCCISFYDIVYDPELVMDQLSKLTNRPISDNIRSNYERYLVKQQELVANLIPWLNDK